MDIAPVNIGVLMENIKSCTELISRIQEELNLEIHPGADLEALMRLRSTKYQELILTICVLEREL